MPLGNPQWEDDIIIIERFIQQTLAVQADGVFPMNEEVGPRQYRHAEPKRRQETVFEEKSNSCTDLQKLCLIRLWSTKKQEII